MTIERNLARYWELDKARTQGDELPLPCQETIGDKAFIAESVSILRDLETAVEVIKVLREALEEINGEQSCGNFNAQQALALAAEKMGEPTSRSE